MRHFNIIILIFIFSKDKNVKSIRCYDTVKLGLVCQNVQQYSGTFVNYNNYNLFI